MLVLSPLLLKTENWGRGFVKGAGAGGAEKERVAHLVGQDTLMIERASASLILKGSDHRKELANANVPALAQVLTGQERLGNNLGVVLVLRLREALAAFDVHEGIRVLLLGSGIARHWLKAQSRRAARFAGTGG